MNTTARQEQITLRPGQVRPVQPTDHLRITTDSGASPAFVHGWNDALSVYASNGLELDDPASFHTFEYRNGWRAFQALAHTFQNARQMLPAPAPGLSVPEIPRVPAVPSGTRQGFFAWLFG
jgi:hypothetical protein